MWFVVIGINMEIKNKKTRWGKKSVLWAIFKFSWNSYFKITDLNCQALFWIWHSVCGNQNKTQNWSDWKFPLKTKYKTCRVLQCTNGRLVWDKETWVWILAEWHAKSQCPYLQKGQYNPTHIDVTQQLRRSNKRKNYMKNCFIITNRLLKKNSLATGNLHGQTDLEP